MGLGERLGGGAGALGSAVVTPAENGQFAIMRRTSFTLAAAAAVVLSPATGAFSQAAPKHPRAGDVYEIDIVEESSSSGSDGSSSTSHDRDGFIERVVAVRADGVELEYDVPASTEGREDVWQFPARVFRPRQGPLQLLNRAELEARVEAWLKRAKLPRAACGHWYFSWNAFQVQCDPQSVIATLDGLDSPVPELRDGAPYRDPEAGAPAPLKRKRAGPDGGSFRAEMPLDAERVRRQRAEADVAVGEIMHKPVTLEAALRERAKERVSGTIAVELEADSAGNVRRRTRVVKVETRAADGRTEKQTSTQTLERRLMEERRPAESPNRA